MNDIIQDLEAKATNGKENFCYISEKQLNTIKELSKREAKEIKQLQQESKQLKEEKRKVRDYINKHCVNEKISKEVGYKCYTMADTNELEKIMKILEDKEVSE